VQRVYSDLIAALGLLRVRAAWRWDAVGGPDGRMSDLPRVVPWLGRRQRAARTTATCWHGS
jgi:hypothetical protein